MFKTLQALLVVGLALLPGAAYTFAFERVVGSFGVAAADRLIRFVAASAVFHALFLALTYHLYREYVRSGALSAGEVNPWLLEGFALVYVLLPTATGLLLGNGKRHGWRGIRHLVGEGIEPRAWDFIWARQPEGFVRLRMKSGIWVGGYYGTTEDGRRSFAAGYPEPGDLYIAKGLSLDANTGELILDSDGQPMLSNGGLLIRWDEVEYLELVE